MKKIWGILKSHWSIDYSPGYYASVIIFLGLSLTANKWINFESHIDAHLGSFYRVVGYFLLYGFAYYAGLAIVFLFKREVREKATLRFWFFSLFGLMVLALDSGFPYLSKILDLVDFDFRIYIWAFRFLGDALGFVFVTLPLFLVYPFLPQPNRERYGLITRGYDVKPYFLILMLMVPLIAGASFTEGFNSFYPIAKPGEAAEVLHWPEWAPAAITEFFYGLDFFNVELLFRGFLVIGLSQWLGKDAIVPMVTTYCFLHFGKPIGEAISSIAGGYILGVLALYTRGIWGGVIVHMGIAWMMEAFAFVQKA